jgi:hypothetical protein
MEARRVFAEQSLRMLPRVRRLTRELWGLVEALEQKYADTVRDVWRLLQQALVIDVDCYLRVLNVKSADELMDIASECYERLRPLSLDLSRALEWLERGYVNELGRCYSVGGRACLPVDVLNELEKEVRGYLAVKRRAVELSLRAGMGFPAGNGELESALFGAWEAYARLAKLQVGVIIRYPERAYLASLYLACAVEFLGYVSTLAEEIRRQEEKVAGLEACDYDPSCSALEAGELNVRREYWGLLRLILEGRSGGAWRAYRNATLAALELVPLYLAYGVVPTLCFRFLDRVSGVLLRSMLSAAIYACRRVQEVLGGEGEELRLAMRLTRSMLAIEELDREKGPIRSILRAREEDRKRLLEGGCSTIERLLIEKDIL